ALAADFHRTRYVQVGEGAGATIELPAAVLRSAGVQLLGQGAGSVPKDAFARVLPEILPAVFGLLERGVLSVETAVRPLAAAAEAWVEPTSSGVRTVLVPWPAAAVPGLAGGGGSAPAGPAQTTAPSRPVVLMTGLEYR